MYLKSALNPLTVGTIWQIGTSVVLVPIAANFSLLKILDFVQKLGTPKIKTGIVK